MSLFSSGGIFAGGGGAGGGGLLAGSDEAGGGGAFAGGGGGVGRHPDALAPDGIIAQGFASSNSAWAPDDALAGELEVASHGFGYVASHGFG